MKPSGPRLLFAGEFVFGFWLYFYRFHFSDQSVQIIYFFLIHFWYDVFVLKHEGIFL